MYSANNLKEANDLYIFRPTQGNEKLTQCKELVIWEIKYQSGSKKTQTPFQLSTGRFVLKFSLERWWEIFSPWAGHPVTGFVLSAVLSCDLNLYLTRLSLPVLLTFHAFLSKVTVQMFPWHCSHSPGSSSC